jgi:hypothetical protein
MWLRRNAQKLFGENSGLLRQMIELNRNSFKSGVKTEGYAVQHLIDKYDIPSDDIIQYCNGSIEDRVNSRDIKFTINGKSYYIQVKPLQSINKIDDYYEVYTSGMSDKYKKYNQKTVDYIGYANKDNLILFPNSYYSTQDKGKKTLHYKQPIEVLK